MTRDRLVSVFVVLTVTTVGVVVAWLVTRPEPRSSQMVLVEPTTTPLRDSIREPKAAKKRTGAHKGAPVKGRPVVPHIGGVSRQPVQSPTRTGTNKAPSTPRKRQTPARKPAPSSSPQSPPSSPPAPTQTQPAVSVPLPSVCTQQIKVNC